MYCYQRNSVKLSRGARHRLDDSTLAVLFASRALLGVAARSLASTEDVITLVQYRALVLLASRGDLNVGMLANLLGVHQSTATRLCDRLVTKDLVDRATAAGSRREVLVRLTTAGRKIVDAVAARRRSEISQIVARLAPDQQAAVAEAFTLFAQAAGETPDDAWKLGWTG